MATTVSLLFSKFFLEGPLQLIYTPFMARNINNKDKINTLINNLISVNIFFFSVLVIILFWLVPIIIAFLAPGFEEPLKRLTVNLARCLLPLIVLNFLADLLVMILQFFNHFMIPAILLLIPPLANIIAIVLFKHTLGIYSLIVGNLAGMILTITLLFYFIYTTEVKFELVFDLKTKEIREIIKKVSQFYPAVLANQLRIYVIRMLCSLLPRGNFTAYIYALKLRDYARNMLIEIIPTVIYPDLAKRIAHNNEKEIMILVRKSCRMISFTALPIITIVAINSFDLIRFLFEWGKFRSLDTFNFGIALIIMSLGLFPASINVILRRFLYAQADSKALNRIRVFQSLLMTGFNVIFYYYLGFIGLAMAVGIAPTINCALICLTLRERIPLAKLFLDTTQLKIITSLLSMSLACLVFYRVSIPLDFVKLQLLVKVLLNMAVGFSVYIGCSLLLQLEELRIIKELLLKKITKLNMAQVPTSV